MFATMFKAFGLVIGVILVMCIAHDLGLNVDRLWSLMWDFIFVIVIGKIGVFLWRHNFPPVTPPSKSPTYGRALRNAQVIQLIQRQKEKNEK